MKLDYKFYEKIKTANEYDIVEEFSYLFFNMQYDEAMQLVGIMKSRGMEDARRLEMMLYYEQKNYAKIRSMFHNIKQMGTEEKEFYLVSLVELGLIDEFIAALSEISDYEDKNGIRHYITIDCYYYLMWLINKQKCQDEIIKKIKHNSGDVHSYFQRKYTACIVDELVDIYCLTEESINLKSAGVSDEDIKFIGDRIDEEFSILKKIYCETDIFYSIYKSGKPLPVDMISFIAKMNVVPVGPRGVGIYDVVHYMELHRKMSPLLLKDIIVEYEKKLKDAVKLNNDYVISFLKKTYLAVMNFADDSYKEIFERILGEVPYIFEDINIHKDENSILNILSDKGKIAYKSALMQFSYSLEHDYGAIDAGMLCLSYMRILELEVSQKIVIPLVKNFADIESVYVDCLNSIDDDDKKSKFVKNWSYLISELKKVAVGEVDGLMMGAINKLFDKMKVKKYKDAYSEKLRAGIDKYLKQILSDKGNSSISDLQNIFSAKNRDKYRNPPAHTRYVGINTALECRSFVETSFSFIDECVR